MSGDRPLIVVSNDDGLDAPGIAVLAEAMKPLGDVHVVAPSREQSGKSHAITFSEPLRAWEEGPRRHRVEGTPVDCVYLACLELCERKPSLVVSGINAGLNLASDVFYSGTVGAAAEGVFRGVPGLALSVDRRIDPGALLPAAQRLARALLEEGVPQLWSANLALVPEDGSEPQLYFSRLGQRPYLDGVYAREDLLGRPYYLLGGPPRDLTKHAEGTDTWAVAQGFVSVTPLELDLTPRDHDARVEAMRARLVVEGGLA